jgi:hypothetical protein
VTVDFDLRRCALLCAKEEATLSPDELADLRIRLKRYFHSKKLEGLLSGKVGGFKFCRLSPDWRSNAFENAFVRDSTIKYFSLLRGQLSNARGARRNLQPKLRRGKLIAGHGT